MPEGKAQETNPVVAYGAWIADVAADWPEDAWASARRQFIDVIGVSIPGAADPATAKVLAAVRHWGDGPATIIGWDARLAAPWAALVNGTAAHALDFDDNFDPPKAHATAVLAPAILALAEQEKASGRACLDAYLVGLQIMGRVGQGLNPFHRNRGWHATATIGAIGAAAACARLLRLAPAEAGHAISIATSMSAGFMSQFGTMTKPLHAGLAAEAGVMAASLAREGIDAGLHTLDGPTGMNRLMVGPDYETLRDGLTHFEHGQTLRFETRSIGDPLLILSSGFRVKRFPNCGSAHRAMDGLLALRDRMGFEANDLSEIRVRAPATHLNNLMYPDPTTPAQAKFSLEFGLAMIARFGRCSLSDFDDRTVMDPEIRALYPIIHRLPVDKAEGEMPTEVEVTLRDGRRERIEVPMPAGSLAAPFTDAQYRTKFEECAAPFIPAATILDLHAMLDGFIELHSIAPLMDLLGRPVSGASVREAAAR